MIKVVTHPHNGNKPRLYLGFDRNNTEKLHDGQPILITGATIGIDCDIILLAGETLTDVIEDLRALGIPITAEAVSKEG